MPEITAAMVRSLRDRSGLPMMDCKQALTETSGDEEAAMELLRKRGAAAAQKKAGRETAEGRIGSHFDAQKGVAALVELLCETAPVANNPDFRVLANQIAKQAASTGTTDPAKLLAEKCVDDPKLTVQDLMHDVLNRLRENMKLARVAVQSGPRLAVYVHHTGRLGVIFVAEGTGGDADLLNDVCMHIAAMQPDAVSREEIPAEVIEKEKEIARVQILESGKPENMVDKIMTGKINRWYSEHVLVEQLFVKDDKKTVGEVLKSAGLTAKRFVRLDVGGS